MANGKVGGNGEQGNRRKSKGGGPQVEVPLTIPS